MRYQSTIGLEIHAELKTKTKMFCSCKNDPLEKRPNVNVCPICLGHPGTLPTANREAVHKVLKFGAAIGATLAEESRFDRKNYFYPDLPKGYQISQYQHPLVKEGILELPFSKKKIRITRAHLEEDAARNVHEKGSTLVDYNRAGIPLMELVTEPDMKSAKEAGEFAEELQLIFKYLGVSDADMEKGLMRVEANVSVSAEKEKLGTKVEVKNINSFRAVQRAIEYEIKRQSELLENGERVIQETRGWDDANQKTVSQRSKEEAHDYRYFPEPDLPPLKLSEVPEFLLEALTRELPELPDQKRTRFAREYAVTGEKLEIFVHDRKLSDFFEAAVSELNQWAKPAIVLKTRDSYGREALEKRINLLTNYITSDLIGTLKENGISIEDMKVTAENFAELIKLVADKEVSSRGAKDILRKMVETGGDPSDIVKEEGLLVSSDTGALEEIVKSVIASNEKAVSDYRSGKEASLQFLVGQAMREAKSRKIGANPETLKEIFLRNF